MYALLPQTEVMMQKWIKACFDSIEIEKEIRFYHPQFDSYCEAEQTAIRFVFCINHKFNS